MGKRSAQSLPVSQGPPHTGCLALGHMHPGKAPSQGPALGPALRNKEQQVSLGPGIQRWEDSNDPSGDVCQGCLRHEDPAFWRGRRKRGAGSEGQGPVEEGIVRSLRVKTREGWI